MKMKLLTLCLLLQCCSSTIWGQIEAQLLGNWQNPSLPSTFLNIYNDVWGFEHNGQEYAVIGTTVGTHFIILDGPDAYTEVAFVPGADQGSAIIHRDFHSYQNYVYAVADEGNSSLQIIDFSGLPETVEVVYDSNELIWRSHNIFIDEANAQMYESGGRIYSLANPEQPVQVGNIAGNFHDIFVRDNIVYANNGNAGLEVYDCSTPSNPVLLGVLDEYINNGYNHSGWLSDDGKNYFMCDETGGRDVKTVNVENYSDMEVRDLYNSGNVNPSHIAHNAMVRGDLLFVSYYSDGLQVFDISDPEAVYKKYEYDTYPGTNNSGFRGAWGIYALLPSGRILVSDMSTGLYVVSLPDAAGTYIDSPYTLMDCNEGTAIFEMNIDANFDAAGVTLSNGTLPAGASVAYSANPAAPGETVTITVNNPDNLSFDLSILAEDGTASFENNISIIPDPGILLSYPNDNSTIAFLNTNLNFGVSWIKWQGVEEVEVEISTDSNFDNIIFSQPDVANSYLGISLDLLTPGTQYFWRVKATTSCGTSSELHASFYYAGLRTVTVSDDMLESCVGESVDLMMTLGEAFLPDVTQLTYESDEGLVLDFGTLNLDNLSGGDEFMITVDETTPAGLYEIRFVITDGNVTTIRNVEVEVFPFPEYPTLVTPADGTVDYGTFPFFEWAPVPASNTSNLYFMYLSTSESFDSLIVERLISPDDLVLILLQLDLQENTTYYWSISIISDCPLGDAPVASFTTGGTNAVGETSKGAIRLFPNPARDLLQLQVPAASGKILDLELLSTDGRMVRTWNTPRVEEHLTLDVSEIPSGVYWLKIRQAEEQQVLRVVLIE